MFWIVAQHKEECKAPRKAGGCESEREDLLELLRVDELSSSGQRRQRRSGAGGFSRSSLRISRLR